MDARSRLTSKGQVTIPKRVRDALDLHEGDELLFKIERSRAIIAKTPDFLELAGSVPIPAGRRGSAWDDIIARTHARRARSRH